VILIPEESRSVVVEDDPHYFLNIAGGRPQYGGAMYRFTKYGESMDQRTGGVKVTLHRHYVPIVKLTTCGAWVRTTYEADGPLKWVSFHTVKAYAYISEADAWQSFVIRQRHRRRHLSAAVATNNAILAFAQDKVTP
jgi:hypothetical protein